MAQVRSVISEALQASVRRLLPSQSGFTEDLQASNVIIPVVDLTPTAEGSQLPTYLQRAMAHGSNTPFAVENQNTTIITTTGFFNIIGTATFYNGATPQALLIQTSDGLSTKNLWGFDSISASSSGEVVNTSFDLVVFVAAGENVTISATNLMNATGSSRQLADVNGNLVNPSGFVTQ